MEILNRRKFLKGAFQCSAGVALTTTVPGLLPILKNMNLSSNNITARIPLPIQVVIDDVGWWSGEDGNQRQEPYRTGIKRNHTLEDYKAIVELGRALNIRPQAAMILCEWDKHNILRKIPTITWMREKWDNSKWVGPWLEEAADVITSNAEHYEFTIHGVGHEYWESDEFTRAEWADPNGSMRPLDQVEKHLDAFAEIMDQNQLGSFPTSFVPTAFRHGFGLTGSHQVSMAEVLKQRGVSYINTPFSMMQNFADVQYDLYGVDHGVMTIDRGNDQMDWDIIGKEPTKELTGPTCGMHWPNLLHKDPVRNSEIVEGWVRFLAPYNEKSDTMLAPNSSIFQAQLVHFVNTKIETSDSAIRIDFTKTDTSPDQLDKKDLTIKITSPFGLAFKSSDLTIEAESLIKSKGSILYTMILKRLSDHKQGLLSFSKM